MEDEEDEDKLTLDSASEAFQFSPNNHTAADYLKMLMQYEVDGMIGDDTFLNGLNEIHEYLNHRNEWD